MKADEYAKEFMETYKSQILGKVEERQDIVDTTTIE